MNWLRSRLRRAYTETLRRSISNPPDHVAVIQDGNRRYAAKQGLDESRGHNSGAETTEELLHWCEEVSIQELTLYTLSTENFARPDDELESLYDLITEKLYKFADADLTHDSEVQIRCLGDPDQLPPRVVEAIQYAEAETAAYDQLQLNIALAYGGRNELLQCAKAVTTEVAHGDLAVEDISVSTIEEQLYEGPIRTVDLIIRTGGDERTSNFLPWYASGNEAAVYFCTPYWPEFNKAEFYRAIRTYESREQSWQQDQAHRAVALIHALAKNEYHDHSQIVSRVWETLADNAQSEVKRLVDMDHSDTQIDLPTDD
jgi:tritrans,polycis-undecaprenyl-diphosphate synthase [geranylgeranyl-diphosphate specific]